MIKYLLTLDGGLRTLGLQYRNKDGRLVIGGHTSELDCVRYLFRDYFAVDPETLSVGGSAVNKARLTAENVPEGLFFPAIEALGNHGIGVHKVKSLGRILS